MKIAVISMIREPWGGSEELWFAMAKQAIAEGHTVMHMSYDFAHLHPRLAELQQMGGLLFQRPGYYPPGLSARGRTLRMGINFIRKKIRNPFSALFRHRPDIVLYNGTCYSIAGEKHLLNILSSNKTRFFILGHFNNEQDRGFGQRDRNIILSAYDRALKVFFIARRSRGTAMRQLCRDIPNSEVLRNPVNMRDLTPLPFPTGATVHWATVGNLLTVHKGQDILLSVLQATRWRERDWLLNIYGDGSDRQYLQELTAYYGLQTKVIFHGKVDDIRKVWQQNQVLLMPSHMEGMPLAIVEAMLCGRPCIATDVGDAAEWIEDGVTGFIADAATILSLDRTMERAWQEKEQWAAIGLRAHHRALELYDPAPGKTLLDKLINS
jgi:glycosyltransferase involved in cell wall biosynthesis